MEGGSVYLSKIGMGFDYPSDVPFKTLNEIWAKAAQTKVGNVEDADQVVSLQSEIFEWKKFPKDLLGFWDILRCFPPSNQ